MTDLQKRFVQEYLVDLNATQAAIRAGYSKRSARQVGAENLSKHDIAEAVRKGKERQLAKSDLTAHRVLAEVALIAFQRASSAFRPDGTLKSPGEWDDATDATIASVETEEEIGYADEHEPQPNGGSLARKRLPVKLTLTRKVKRYDKNKALELLMRHFGLLKEDAPHPDRPRFDLSKLTDAAKRTLLDGLRVVLGRPTPGVPAIPAGRPGA